MQRRQFLLTVALGAAGSWKVSEDLDTLEGVIEFLSPEGAKVTLERRLEPCFPGPEPQHLGIDLRQIGLSGPDLLADRLLSHGDPDPEEVKLAAPPLGSAPLRRNERTRWNTFVGTRECLDTAPVFPAGNTRTYHPQQYFPELREPNRKRYEGLLGGWMPAVRKVFPLTDTSYIEILVFGDVEAKDRFIVQTWHRGALVSNGKIEKVIFGYSYPAYPPSKLDPKPEDFYLALLKFSQYWDRQLAGLSPCSLPDVRWTDMVKHSFAKELMARPGGVYPKYGAVDRDYYGSEYDGFQDTFTSSLYTNLEWGRFAMARAVFDNYFTDFVDARGAINMRGPETAQFGLTLLLVAKYLRYTGDRALVLKHASKIEATAAMLLAMHDASLKLPESSPGYGLIAGWNESDACLDPLPGAWWQPYFANSAFAARGLADLAGAWEELGRPARAKPWRRRAELLRDAVRSSVDRNTKRDMVPPYIGPLPGASLTFRDSMATEKPSPQQWPHRAYAELLQADILTPAQANLVVDCMRAYGATTLGVLANVGQVDPNGRDILGFIAYGYAQALLRLDRVEEYLLFLYSHAFHDHTRGSWTAGEVAPITGGTATFCVPAQQTIPLVLRWMLVFEDSDESILYFAKAIPRAWLAAGKEIRIGQAPTRWGRVDFHMRAAAGSITATIELPAGRAPRELHVKFRLPIGQSLETVTVGGRQVAPRGETVVVPTANARRFEIVARTQLKG